MPKMKVEHIVEEMVQPILDRQHCELVDIEYKKKEAIGTCEYT